MYPTVHMPETITSVVLFSSLNHRQFRLDAGLHMCGFRAAARFHVHTVGEGSGAAWR